jgi:hypothetical protein
VGRAVHRVTRPLGDALLTAAGLEGEVIVISVIINRSLAG